ncbi:hypothetical protein PILCRDRAFT_830537 [Piloderma croceum F 1598]|jgi:hypothetical protein|uniref:Uncharacterized protein n=1 Tax=Piloderma croceum (strain F 1598) TaxID=765440 RepID=A0A0C3ABH4_PILCF|nr:hypothetical protein PILCRDRAFT_830537 [Piloderma croceum F 1598]
MPLHVTYCPTPKSALCAAVLMHSLPVILTKPLRLSTHVSADLWPLLWSIFSQIGNSLFQAWIGGQGDGLWKWAEGVWGMCREMVRAHTVFNYFSVNNNNNNNIL